MHPSNLPYRIGDSRTSVWFLMGGLKILQHLGHVIGHYFHSHFSSIFSPTSITFLTTPFPSVFIFLMFFFLCLIHTHEQTTRTLPLVQPVTDKLDLLGYQHPETVLFLFPNPILHRDPLSRSRLLPQLKVLDFPNMEHK